MKNPLGGFEILTRRLLPKAEWREEIPPGPNSSHNYPRRGTYSLTWFWKEFTDRKSIECEDTSTSKIIVVIGDPFRISKRMIDLGLESSDKEWAQILY